MSRIPVRTFLVQAKRHLEAAAKNDSNTSLVVGNESADLDSITCAIVYGYIQSSKPEARRTNNFIVPVTNIPASDLTLRPELTALLKHAGVQPSDLITLDDVAKAGLPTERTTWTLVDHNALTGSLAEQYSNAVVGVIDHHDDEKKVPRDGNPRVIEKSGSCNSLVANHCRNEWDTISSAASSVGAALGQESYKVVDDFAFVSGWDAQVAKLAVGSILIDTNNMTSEDKVTDHDRKAMRYLEARINISRRFGKDYDRTALFEELSKAKSDLDDLSVRDILRKDYKEWKEGDLTLGVSSVVKPVDYLEGKTESLVGELLDFAKSRDLDICAVMTAYTTESGDFARQLLVLAVKDGKSADAAEKFAKSSGEELKLSDLSLEFDNKVAWLRLWDQQNVSASRKRVGPLLREAMR